MSGTWPLLHHSVFCSAPRRCCFAYPVQYACSAVVGGFIAQINLGFLLERGHGKADLWPRSAPSTPTAPAPEPATPSETHQGACSAEEPGSCEAGQPVATDEPAVSTGPGLGGGAGSGNDTFAWEAWRNVYKLRTFLLAADNVGC